MTDQATEDTGHVPGVVDAPSRPVEVVEPPISPRVRRPADLWRLVVVSAVVVVSIATADFAVGTADALEQDLHLATSGAPLLLLQLFSWLSGLGIVVLPLAVGADLLVRRRPLQLVEALAASGAGALIVLGLRELILGDHLGDVLGALTRAMAGGRTNPLDPVLVSLVALLTVADIVGRKGLAPLAFVVVVASAVTEFVSGQSTALAVFVSTLLGWGVGLAVRYGAGALSTRPPGRDVAAALIGCGVPVDRLVLADPDLSGDRRYVAETGSGPLEVMVMDRDTFGVGSGRRLWRLVRLRSAGIRAPAFSVRGELEHRTLLGLALADAGILAPRPVAVCEVGPFSACIAYAVPSGRTVEARTSSAAPLDEAALDQLWQVLVALRQHRIGHRGLAPDTLVVTDDGRGGLARVGSGDIAAADLTMRIDVAQMLTTIALAVGAPRAVASGIRAIGGEAISTALPLLQPIALTASARQALKQDKTLLGQLRDEVTRLRPQAEVEAPVELRRLTPRTLLTIVGLGVAGYLILTQLAQVDLGRLVSSARWEWALATVLFSALTFAGASTVLTGSVSTPLRFVRTYMTQLAVAFSGLVAPAVIGNLALNTRYLQKSGVKPAVAAASVGVAQVAQFCSYVILLVGSGVVAGTGPRASFQPPAALVAAIPIVVVVIIGLLAVPRIRAVLRTRLLPQVRTVVPQVLAVFQHPHKVLQLLGGAMLLDASFVAALVCATRAFGADPSIAAVAVVYFAGAIIGSAVPTPGGLGGIEAALSAGLIALGVDSGIAVSSVLLYRLATYWLPIPLGWLSLNRLTKVAAI